MRRVVIVGNGGSGKSTLARQLGEILGLDLIHLDVHFWHPGWVPTPRAQWREIVAELVLTQIARHEEGRPVVVLHTPDEVRRWLDGVRLGRGDVAAVKSG